MTNEIFHPYNLDESTFNSRGVGSYFSFLFSFFKEICVSEQNSHRWDVASHLGLFCLPLSHNKGCQA